MMKQVVIGLIMSAIATCCLSQTNKDIIGIWEGFTNWNNPITFTIRPDGTFHSILNYGGLITDGKYSLNGNKITFKVNDNPEMNRQTYVATFPYSTNGKRLTITNFFKAHKVDDKYKPTIIFTPCEVCSQ